MSTKLIIEKLESIEKMLTVQTLVKKEVLSFKEAAVYVGLSHSYLYHLTSRNKIPAYKPNDGKLFFKRMDLYNWMLSKRKTCSCEIKSDCKSLDPAEAVSQLVSNTRIN